MEQPVYTLIVIVPYDENFSKVERLLETSSYRKAFRHSFVPPHRIEYVFNSIPETVVVQLKEQFRDIFKDSPYRNICSFNVT